MNKRFWRLLSLNSDKGPKWYEVKRLVAELGLRSYPQSLRDCHASILNALDFPTKQLCHFLAKHTVGVYRSSWMGWMAVAWDTHLKGILLTFKWALTLSTSDAFTKKWTSFFFSMNSAVTGCQRTTYSFQKETGKLKAESYTSFAPVARPTRARCLTGLWQGRRPPNASTPHTVL